MARGKPIKKKEWPCGYCDKNCDSFCLFCDVCERWYHNSCQNLDKDDLREFGTIKEGYICIVCRSDNEGSFDYLMGLSRLNKAADQGIEKLRTVVQRENMICKESFSCTRREPQDVIVDPIAEKIRKENTSCNGHIAATASADGDCLFNAVSTLLVGSENLSLELRYRTCLELVLNSDEILKHPSRAAFHLLSPTYSEACLNSAVMGKYSSVWTILALANVVKTPIRTIYPCLNGLKDLAFTRLNDDFKPKENPENSVPLIIMWTSTYIPLKGKLWTPNHFVPLINHYSAKQTSEESFIHHKTGPESTPIMTSKRRPSIDSDDDDDDQRRVHFKKPRLSASYSESMSIISPNRYSVLESSESDDEVLGSDDDDNDDIVSPTVQSPTDYTDGKIENIRPLPRKKQLDPEELLDFITGTVGTVSDIPDGKKENVYVLLDNKTNIQKTLSGERANYSDDCGVWESKKGHTVKTKFLVNDRKLKYVVEKQGHFYVEKKVSGKKTLISIEPQPTKDMIVTLHRYYTVLKREPTYKKRVSWFDGPCMQSFGHRQFVAVIEYIGCYPESGTPHGNAKLSNDVYKRTNPEVLQHIKNNVQDKKPTKVYSDMTKLDDSKCFPRDLKQVQNCKQNTQQRTNYRSNVADEILQVISMLNSHEYVAEIIHSRNQGPPVIICYTEDQITDFRSFLRSQSGVIGVDRTFNLGKCFVTTVVYKSNKVLRKTTGEPPILLGPLFLHWDGQSKTYHHFFSHLRGILDLDLKNIELMIGTDDEKAMTKAIDISFPEATRKLCTKHIKDNIRHYLTDKAPTDVKTRQQIIDKIFGPNGIVSAENSFEFDEKNEELKSDFSENQDFLTYYDRHVKNKLLYHVMNDRTDDLWTNNNAESMNHRIKQACDWKALKTDDLIDRLYDIVRVQMTDLRRSLYGSGNFTLNTKFQKFKLSPSLWSQKNAEEKQLYFSNFLKFTSEKKPKVTVSTNGQYSVKTPQHLARKPNQTKRCRPCRTQKKNL